MLHVASLWQVCAICSARVGCLGSSQLARGSDLCTLLHACGLARSLASLHAALICAPCCMRVGCLGFPEFCIVLSL